jgi:hypothetical protein
MGPTAALGYFLSEGRHAEDSFALKIRPAWCEPANLGTKGQHATSRPPKPLSAELSQGIKNTRLASSFYTALLLTMF